MAGAPAEAAVEECNADHKVVLRAGEGPMPNEGATVRVHVKGWLCETDLVITNTQDKEEPAQFLLGQGQVLAGIDQAVSTMQVGELCRVTIPPEKGYGAEGWAPNVPPEATLKFELSLEGFDDVVDEPQDKRQKVPGKLEAQKVLDELELRITKASALKDEGNAAFKKGRETDACKRYRAGIKQFEYKKGRCALEGESLEQASSLLVSLHTNLAMCQIKLCEWEFAERNARRAIQLDETNQKARLKCAIALENQEKKAGALRCLEFIPQNDRVSEVKKKMAELEKWQQAEKKREKKMYGNMFA